MGKAALDGTGKNARFIDVGRVVKPAAVAITPQCPTTSYTASGSLTQYFAQTYQPSEFGYATTCGDSRHVASVTTPTNAFTDGQVNRLSLQKLIGSSWSTVASSSPPPFGEPTPIDYVGGPGTYRWQVEAGYVPKYPGPYRLSLVTPVR